MVRIRHGWLVTALAAPLCLGLALGACKKDEKKADPTTAQKPGETPAEKPAENTPGAPASASTNANVGDLSLLPVDSEVVMGLNFAQLQTSMLWKKFVEPQLMKDDAQQKLAEFKTRCGFDPLEAVTSVSLGMKGVGEDVPDGVVVVHGPPKAQVLGCLDKMKDEAAKDGATITSDGGVVTIKSKGGETIALTYVNDTTMLVVIGANATPAGIQTAAKGGSTLQTSPAFVEMYGKINTQDSMWLLMNGNAKAFDKAAQMGFKPKAVFGSVNVTDGLALDLRVRLDSPDQASQIANMAKSQVAQFAKMVDKLDITNDAADVRVDVAMSTAKLEALVKQFGGLLGGMGGP